jgi:hypothetical protein
VRTFTGRRQTTVVLAKERTVLWIIAVVLFVLWALGLATAYTMGGIIHLLLVLAVITLVVGFFQRRRSA